MKVLGVITARGGSVRYPNKNIATLGGKPLLAWSIEVGLKACDYLVTSTDSHEIGAVAMEHDSHVVMRPPELQGDADHVQVVIHAAKTASGGPYNAVMLLQPTSPFRTVEDCAEAKNLMTEVNAESVISVVEFPNRDTLFTLGHGSRMRDVNQYGGTVYTPNGAIYLVEWSHLLAGESWYGPHSYAYVMPRERSLDIDTHADFEAALAMLDADGKFDPQAIVKKATTHV